MSLQGSQDLEKGLEKGLEFHFEIPDLEMVGHFFSSDKVWKRFGLCTRRSGIYIKYHEKVKILDLDCPKMEVKFID